MIEPDNDRRVDTDLHCVVCGYNVRGLRTVGRCTECGSPVVWAAHGSELLVADPSWLMRVCRGHGLVTLSFLWGWFPSAWPVLIVGALKLTSPAPPGAPVLRGLAAPTGLRLCLLVLPFLCPALVIASLQSGETAGGSAFLDCYVGASILAATCGQCVLALFIFRLLRRSATPRFRVWCIITACLSLLSLMLYGLGWFVPQKVYWMLRIGIVLEVFALPAFLIIMCSGWRLLDRLQYQSEAIRQEPRAWDRYRGTRGHQREAAIPPGGSVPAPGA